ncbi:tetratricopeptide repeat protein [candidate division CSSED10-310 bacterium]|uniref:Tetratricopeptide repeat protein n=1 Tax=candidate division CSSED10-310 bacterium TaxID=2855610 RepID=A0ABV6YR15_UNCC1
MTSIPQHIGSFRILRLLGEGGMGVVYLARHESSGETVALKTLRVAQKTHLEGIRREIRALAKIRHPGVVRIVAEGVHDGLPWYAMDFVCGVTLRQYMVQHCLDSSEPGPEIATDELTRDGPLLPGKQDEMMLDTSSSMPGVTYDDHSGSLLGTGPGDHPLGTRAELAPVLLLIRRLCAPLAFLHGEGIVHRDLKPENIMVTEANRPVIVDFGLMARFTGKESRDRLRVDRGGGGTVSYMAPEQIRGEFVDSRADLFALGCILYELLIGHPPTVSRKPSRIRQGHSDWCPVAASRYRPDVSPALDELISRLLANDPRDRVGHADVVAHTLARISGDEQLPEGPKPKAYLYRARLAGRAAILQTLRKYDQKLLDGGGGFVLLGGQSGIGKTRLVMEFGRELARNGVLVLTGECSEVAGRSFEALLKPLQAIVDRCREQGPAETCRILGCRGKVLALYEPSVADLPGLDSYPDPVELPPDAAKLRLFSCLSEIWRELANDNRVALIIDDLQWADDLVLDYFRYELRTDHLPRTPLMILGTYRSETVAENLRCLITTAGVEHHLLKQLDEDSTAIMVSDMLGITRFLDALSQYLSLTSGGNPLFVSKYLLVAIETGLLARDERGAWYLDRDLEAGMSELELFQSLPVPTSLPGLIEQRLAGLSANARLMVEAGAVFGREISVDLLWEITDLDSEELIDACHELLQHSILEIRAAESIQFTNAQIRHISLGQLSEQQQTELHRRAAQAIEKVLAPDIERYLGDLAFHWEAAGELENARVYALKAARQARKQHNYGEAAKLYGTYLQLEPKTTQQSLEARQEFGQILPVIGQHDAALKELCTVRETTAEKSIKAVCYKEMAAILTAQGKTQEARQSYREALALAEHFPLEKASILNNMAYFECVLQSNHEEAEKLYNQSLTIVTSLFPATLTFLEGASSDVSCPTLPQEVHKVLATTANGFGLVYSALGDPERSLHYYEKSLALFEHIQAIISIAVVSCNVGIVHFNHGNLDRALQFYQKALELSQQICHLNVTGMATCNMGVLCLTRSDLDRAHQYLHTYREISKKIGNRKGIGMAASNMGLVYQARGDLETALQYFQESLAISEEIGYRRGVGLNHGNIGLFHRDRGDLDLALEFLHTYLNISTEIGEKLSEADVCLEISEVHRLKKEHNQSLHMIGNGLNIFNEFGFSLRIGDCWCRKAEVLIDQGDLEVAAQALEKAEHIYKQNQGGQFFWRLPLIKSKLVIQKALKSEATEHPRSTGQILQQAQYLGDEAHHNQRLSFKIEAFYLQGLALRIIGKPEEAASVLAKAQKLARDHNHRLLARTISQAL